MKSWLHNIAESYIYETPATRRDLKEHYNLLTEEEKFALLSENALLYLDEQLKNAYGFGVGDLNEEELGTLLEQLRDRFSTGKEVAARGDKVITDPETGKRKLITGKEAERTRDARLVRMDFLLRKNVPITTPEGKINPKWIKSRRAEQRLGNTTNVEHPVGEKTAQLFRANQALSAEPVIDPDFIDPDTGEIYDDLKTTPPVTPTVTPTLTPTVTPKRRGKNNKRRQS